MENTGKEFEDNEKLGMPKRADHDLKLWKEDIPLPEFKDMYMNGQDKTPTKKKR
jgi:hypothetical protein